MTVCVCVCLCHCVFFLLLTTNNDWKNHHLIPSDKNEEEKKNIQSINWGLCPMYVRSISWFCYQPIPFTFQLGICTVCLKNHLAQLNVDDFQIGFARSLYRPYLMYISVLLRSLQFYSFDSVLKCISNQFPQQYATCIIYRRNIFIFFFTSLAWYSFFFVFCFFFMTFLMWSLLFIWFGCTFAFHCFKYT